MQKKNPPKQLVQKKAMYPSYLTHAQKRKVYSEILERLQAGEKTETVEKYLMKEYAFTERKARALIKKAQWEVSEELERYKESAADYISNKLLQISETELEKDSNSSVRNALTALDMLAKATGMYKGDGGNNSTNIFQIKVDK